MRRIVVAAVALAVSAGVAHAESSGAAALSLGALVGAHSPTLPAHDRTVLGLLLNGHLGVAYPAKRKITVNAAKVTCRASDVDITLHQCTLQFGKTERMLSGREAHEVYATLIESGVASDGAAGSIYESVATLACVIDPAEVKQKGGGGATCTWTTP